MKKKKIIIGEGEVTGHQHALESDTAKFDGERLKLQNPEELSHQEHDTLIITPKKNLKVSTVVEYDSMEEITREIYD